MHSTITKSSITDQLKTFTDIDDLKNNSNQDLAYAIVNDINGKGFSGVYSKVENDRISTGVAKVMVVDSLSNRWKYSFNTELIDRLFKLSDEQNLSMMPTFVSPELFDAVGNGVSDDTDAIIKTFEYINFNDKTLIPLILTGQYRICRDITLSANSLIRGYKELDYSTLNEIRLRGGLDLNTYMKTLSDIEPLLLNGFLVDNDAQLLINNTNEENPIHIKFSNLMVKAYGMAEDEQHREKPFVKDIGVGDYEFEIEEIHPYGFKNFF